LYLKNEKTWIPLCASLRNFDLEGN
jgi:hypothetical protein